MIPNDSSRTDEPVQQDIATRGRTLTPEARRALGEAEVRRRAVSPEAGPHEQGGRGGLDPVRFGDWEIKGLASDF